MAKKHIQYAGDHQAALGKVLRTVGYRHGLWQVFRDFVAMGAIALSNAADKRNFEAREAEYMTIVGRYTKEEADELARGFAHVVMGLEVGLCDFLGSLYMSLELGDSWKGQYFTPYEVSRLMAGITMGDKGPSEVEAKGFITVNDPCIGGGAMVIAAAHAMLDAKINYQQHMHAVGVDIDIVAVHMAYIQLSLLHIPAVIYHGNSLSLEVWSVWHTPAHTLGLWDHKLRRAGRAANLVQPAPDRRELAELGIGELVDVPPTDTDDTPDTTPALPMMPAHTSTSINLRNQIALF